MRITYFALAVIDGIMCVLWVVMGQVAGIYQSGDMSMIVPWCAVMAYVFFLEIYFLRYFVLTEEGIQHKMFGICYRTTPWDRIYKIIVISSRLEKDRNFKVHVLGENEDRTEAELHTKRRKGICGWLGEERFTILCHWRKEEAMLAYINAHCKSVKYEYTREKTTF